MRRAAAIVSGCLIAFAAHAQPPLPEGLEKEPAPQEESKPEPTGPALPQGLEERAPAGPALPEGLEETPAPEAPSKEPVEAEAERHGFLRDWRFTGFVDSRLGLRLKEAVDQEDVSLGELRVQLKALRSWKRTTVTVTADFLADGVAEEHAIDLNKGEGFIDLREAHILWRAASWLDIKAGRQILTWGTGEFIFLNDLFPKDFRSFFIGRQDTYLKAPSDAVKASFFSDVANLDVVYTPQFDPDRFANGDRLSLFNPFERAITGDSDPLDEVLPDDVFEDDEWALRLYRTFGAVEAALYAYDGFWKSPNGQLSETRQVTFTKLSAYGASVRGPVFGGIGNVEFAYYDSREDRDGDDPNVPNSEIRFLLGFEREIRTNLTGAVQVYIEHQLDRDAFLNNNPPGAPERDETSVTFTGKLSRNWPEKQVTATLFFFYSPTDDDAYIRPRLSWNATDNVTVEAGANLLFGDEDFTRFGQLEHNSNVFAGVRVGF